ncbi:DUF4342 domain-containing protein [Candidatus Bipolaricaulota bacterium]|nr:DUF4342 domain-containing protein [Candidatus Bipolaricaulota bacterium]
MFLVYDRFEYHAVEKNIRYVTIKNREGKTLIEIPLTFGVVGVLFLPTLAAIGAIAALVTECTIVAERRDLV